MRLGNNPQKNLKTKISESIHRVIIPVYIPHLEDYYKESLSVFKLCITSLIKTKSSNTAITIVNNGCCKEVCDFINILFIENKIDEVIHTQSVGKINSILKAIKSTIEPYITISDADVLFKEYWLKKTVEIFNNHPKAGVVGLIPQFKMYEYLGYNVIADNLFNSKLEFTKVKDKEGLKLFYKSIGWKDDYNKNYLKYNLSIKNNNIKALVGSGHCVATYKRSLFDNNIEFSKFVLGGDSERVYLDEPCVKQNLWRLTTEESLAYHMGNSIDVCFEQYIEYLNEKSEKETVKVNFKDYLNNEELLKIKYLIKTRVMHKVLKIKKVKLFFYKKKGLPQEILNQY